MHGASVRWTGTVNTVEKSGMCSGHICRSGAIAGRMACILAAALLACASSAHAQVIEEGGFPVKGGGVSGETFSLSCPPRLYVEAGESVLFSCSATAVPEEGVRYAWEPVSGDGLHLLSDAQVLAPLFTAPLSGSAPAYRYRLTAMGGVFRETSTVEVIVEGFSGESFGAPVVQEECTPFTVPEGLGKGCAEDKGPLGFVPGPEEGFLFPEAPGLPDRASGPVRGGGLDRQTPPRLECPVAVFLEELETGAIECQAWDASGEEYLEYSWEPVGSTTRDYLDNPLLMPEDSPTPSVVAPEAPAYETLESFHSGETTFRYRYRLTAMSRATGLSSSSEVEVYVSSSRPVVYCPLEVVVEEGSAVALNCEGADPLSARMDYDEEAASVLWEWEGLWGTSTAPLAATDLPSPLFTAPAGSAGKTYHYIASMTTSASGVPRTARRRVTVRVVGVEGTQAAAGASALAYKGSAPVITCNDAEAYEATGDFVLDCSVTDEPSGATYAWAARGSTSDTDDLANTDSLRATFSVPSEVGGADKNYYRVTLSASGIDDITEDVTVTVLGKPTISCIDTRLHVPLQRYWTTVYDNIPDFELDVCEHGDWDGAPDGSAYTFAWTGRGSTSDTDKLSDLTIEDPVFDVPDVTADEIYEYTLTVSAENADAGSLPVRVTVQNAPDIRLICNDANVIDGDNNFRLDCSVTNEPSGATYAWTGTDIANRLSGTTILKPMFDVPDIYPLSKEETVETYEYTVTLEVSGSAVATEDITITVRNGEVLCWVSNDSVLGDLYDPTVDEGASDLPLPTCEAGITSAGGPPYTYSWIATGRINGREAEFLTATDQQNVSFRVPSQVSSDTEYGFVFKVFRASEPRKYDTATFRITVANLDPVECHDPPGFVYDRAPPFALNCTDTGAPSGVTWHWDPTDHLTNTDTVTPTFTPPLLNQQQQDFRYTVRARANGADIGGSEVTVRMLHSPRISVLCDGYRFGSPVYQVYEGEDDFVLDCSASIDYGVSAFDYVWTGRNGPVVPGKLSSATVAKPTFDVPEEVTANETYEYTLTVSAGNAESGSVDVTVTVLNKPDIVITCPGDPYRPYERDDDIVLDCSASGAPSGSTYDYVWTGRNGTVVPGRLSSTTIEQPTFDVPNEVGENGETYEYTLAVSADNAVSVTEDVTVTVLNKIEITVTCPGDPYSKYEGEDNFDLDCSATGAPEGTTYEYAWTPRGNTPNTNKLIAGTDGPTPTFEAPENVDVPEHYYYYRLTVSAEGAEDAVASVTVTVKNKPSITVACTGNPYEVYAGDDDIVLDCSASGGPSGSDYDYVWTGRNGTVVPGRLSSTTVAKPTFEVPGSVTGNETYEYRLTVSAEGTKDAVANVTVTVKDKPDITVTCTGNPYEVYAGDDDIVLDCSASGGPSGSKYDYVWTPRGSTVVPGRLSSTTVAKPTFDVPGSVTGNETYEYTLTVSADNAEVGFANVTVTVKEKATLTLVCTSPLPVYEGSPDFDLNCSASGAPEGSGPVYVWTPRGSTTNTAQLSGTDGPTPTFHVPPNVNADTDYEYTLTVSARGADTETANVTVRVLNKPPLALVCTPVAPVYEGAEDFALDCSASGAPQGSEYDYVWTGRNGTVVPGRLSSTTVAKPTFDVPGSVTGNETYEYTLTVSADNAEVGFANVTVTVKEKATLTLVCTSPLPVYEGSPDFDLNCSASGAPEGSDPVYVWTPRGSTTNTAQLSGTDGPTPTFHVPPNVNADTDYEYTLTVSARGADTETANVTVRVLNTPSLTLVCTPVAPVYEGAEDFDLDCVASGAPSGSDYDYVWTGRGSTVAPGNLSSATVEKPTFNVPPNVDADTDYEYTLTVSADNTESASEDVTVRVLNKKALDVVCATPSPVYEGSADFALDCAATGAPAGSEYVYVWTGRGTTTNTDLLISGTDGPTPTFDVPEEVDEDETYEYLLTVSAENAIDATAGVTVKVLKLGSIALICASPPLVYEGSEDFELDCSISGDTGDADYTYEWTARGATSNTAQLSATDISSPTFYVPDALEETTTYEYLLTVSAENAEDATAEVTVTVLNRGTLAVACAPPPLVYEGSADFALDCTASGAPVGSSYAYAWTARGATANTDLLIAGTDSPTPTFAVPEALDAPTTYEYLLTVSAENAESASAAVTVTVLNHGALSVVCVDPPSVYERSADFALDCTASGAPAGSEYAYVWTARGSTANTDLLIAGTDGPTPTFDVPEELDATTTYEYLLTVSAENAESGSAEMTVNVLDGLPLAFVDDSISGQVYVFTVSEAITDILLPEATGGLSPYTYTLEPALPPGLELDDPTRTISGTPLEVSPRSEYTWQVVDAKAETVQIAFFIEVAPAPEPPSPPVAESLSLGVTVSASSLRFGVQSSGTQVSLDPMTDQISTQVSGPYHVGRMTLSLDGSEALDENGEMDLSIELASPVVLWPEGGIEAASIVLSPSWSLAESCEQLSSQAIGGLYTEVTLSEGACRLLRFGGELDLTDVPSGRYTGSMDLILRSGESEETHSVAVDVTVISTQGVITIGPGGVRFNMSRGDPLIDLDVRCDGTFGFLWFVPPRSSSSLGYYFYAAAEGDDNITLDCEASGGPDGAAYTYLWTANSATPNTDLLTDPTLPNPEFDVPDITTGPSQRHKDFEYSLTVTASAGGVTEEKTIEVQIFVVDGQHVIYSRLGNYVVTEGDPPFPFFVAVVTANQNALPYNVYSWSGATEALALLSATDEFRPTFNVPDDINADTDYEYVLTISNPRLTPPSLSLSPITVTVLDIPGIEVACTDPDEVYEGAPAFPLACRVQNAPDDVSYSWSAQSGTANTALLMGTDSPTPTFNVPGNVDANTDYGYTLTVSAEDKADVMANVTVTVLNKPSITVACTDNLYTAYEGEGNIVLDCEATGKPSGSDYTYVWTARGSTANTDLLMGTDSPTPTFEVPGSVNSEETYEYTLTASADNAEDGFADVTVKVLEKATLTLTCTPPPDPVYEGAEDFDLDCSASGAPSGSDYAYEWTGRGSTVVPGQLSSTTVEKPRFNVPPNVNANTDYEYTLTVSARGADPETANVTVTVLDKSVLSVTCTNADPELYEGEADFDLDCSASGAPSGSDYAYEWTGRGSTVVPGQLSSTTVEKPTFNVPPNVDADTDYEYTLTVSAVGAHDAEVDVEVTVLNKPSLTLVCTSPPDPVYEGDADFDLNCFATGAPSGSDYDYVWTGRGSTVVPGQLSSTIIAKPTFDVLDEVAADTDYEYTLTVSAENAEDAAQHVTVTVLNKSMLGVGCVHAFAEVYEGADDFEFDCTASGAPSGSSYAYAWTARGSTLDTSLLSATDIRSPLFHVPDAVSSDETYEYTLTVSAENAEDATLDVTVTVLNKRSLIVFCAIPASVYEGAEDVLFDCSASGAPSGVAYAYAWTPRGDTQDTSLLSATDILSPTFNVPDDVQADKTYEYTLTVRASLSDPRSINVKLKVLKAGALSIACAIPLSVYEGSDDVLFDCGGSGAPGDDPQYAYSWTARGDTPDTALLSATDAASPVFAVPAEVDETTTYEYLLTVSAANAEDATLDVAITVLNKRALAVVCADPGSVYEGSADITLDCSASGAPGDNPQYTYAWTPRGNAQGAAALLSATDIASPTFYVPNEVPSTTTYEYVLTVSAENAEDTTLDVAITVLNKGALAVVCTNPRSVYEGSADVAFACEASGAPGDDPEYAYAWTGAATALALLDADNIASPTFSVPEEVSSDETYEYTLTVSARNAEDVTLDVAITVLNKGALAVVCANAFAEVYEGADDFEFDCTASGAPSGSSYAYAWTARGSTLDTSLLSATDIRSPLFHVPDAVSSDETYEYTLTVSAENAEDATLDVTVTVLNKRSLIVFCAIPASVYEGAEDVLFDCSASGAPSGVAYAYAWTPRGDTQDTSLLSATDILSPTFNVPDDVQADKTYEYTLTVRASLSDPRSINVKLKVLKAGALSIACAIPLSVYEGSDDVLFDCGGSGAPGDDPQYAYSWTARGDTPDTALLSATDAASPVFAVPAEVDETTTYEYLLTVSAANAEDATLDVAITVLNKRALAVVCADPGSVYEGSADITLDCSASGAPGDNPQYTYAWTPRGNAQGAAALLSATDIASPTFYVPNEVPSTTTYEYVLTVSAENAEDTTLDVAITVLNKGALAVVCTNPRSVYEGSADVAFACEASGAPGDDPEYAYAWTGAATALALLDADNIASPTFSVPEEVSSDETYEYTLTVSARNAEDVTLDVAITVLNKGALAVVCANAFAEVYEGADDFEFDCSASGAPSGSTYEYAWTARGNTLDTSLLSATDIRSPFFRVPDTVSSDETYEYQLTVSAAGAHDATVEVAVTVLNKRSLIVFCAVPASVYEGAEDVLFDCSASGAPGINPVYAYAWTTRGDTPDTALLSATDAASPVFAVPAEVDETTTYEYLLTVSAANAEDATLDVAITVLNKRALAVVCADPGSVYEGSADITLDCSASGAPGDNPQYTYAWTPRGNAQGAAALLSATDIASPTFYVPNEVPSTTTYEYVLTVSAENAEDTTLDVAITVLNKGALAVVCTNAFAEVYEGADDFEFDCSASGAPSGSTYEYAWTARGNTPDVSLLSAANIASPTFYVPDEADEDEIYEYLLTVSAQNAKDAATEVTVTVLNKSALALTCADPPSVYEGSDDVDLDCSASGGPEGSAYEYVWTARGDTQDTALLSAAGIASPTFYVPDEVDATTTYEYLLTVSAQNADDASVEVAVTVLNKSTLAVVCADPGSVYEGSEDITFDCSASGAPGDNPQYAYAWTARGDTPDVSLLSAADIESPTFYVPDEVIVTTTYEYLLTVSAQNADDGSAEAAVRVLDKPLLAVVCAGPYSLYEGSEDFAFDCEASGAPGDNPQYTYVWTARGDTQDTSLLSATDVATPTFLVPDDLPATTTYEYLLTASAANAEDDSAGVSVTVMHPAPLAFVDDALAGRVFVFTVDEQIEDILLPRATGGFPPYTYTLAPALPEGLALDDPTRTIAGTPLQVSPRTEYTWQVVDTYDGSVSLAFFIEVAPVPSRPVAESLSPDPEALSFSGITTSVSPLRFGVQASNTQVVLDPMTDRITTNVAGPYHTGRMTLSPGGGEEPLAAGEEIALAVELALPVLLRREGPVESPPLVLSPSWSYAESCEQLSSESLGGLYTELLLSEGDCPLLLFGGELDLADALPGRYEGVMDVILRQGEIEETRTLEVDVTVISARRVITIGPRGVRLDTSRELPAGLTEFQNLSIYPDVAFLNAEKPYEVFELSNPSLIPLEVSVSARFGYMEATEEGREIMVENAADSDLGDLSSVVDIHPSVLVLQPGEKGLVRYGIREEVLSSLSEKGYAAFFDVVSAPRQYVALDRMPEEVTGDRTARVTMRIPGVYVSGDGASRLRAELLSITEGISLSATFLVEALDGPFMGEVIAYDGEGRELGRRETLVYTRSRVRVPLSRKPDEETVFLRFMPRGSGRVPEPASVEWDALRRDIGETRDRNREETLGTLAGKP